MNIAFLGDVAFFEWGMIQKGWESRLQIIANELKKYDLVIANLETPITESSSTYVCKGIHLKTSPSVVKLLKYLGIDCVCLANNHIYDYGLKGLMQTIDILKEAGIPYYGVNGSTWLYENGDSKIHFHGYCCYSTNGAGYIEKKKHIGVCALTNINVERDLKNDQELNYFSVLSFHWGDEYSKYPNEKQVSFVHGLAEKYKFIVHGHHAHVMQGIETIDKSVIVYNQGNFYFDECHSEINKKFVIKQGIDNRNSFVLSIELKNNSIVGWNTIGIHFEDDGINLIDNSNELRNLSSAIKDCSKEEYKKQSKKCIAVQKSNNYAKHDFKWLVSKMNYYSIGAYINYYYYKYKYNKAF